MRKAVLFESFSFNCQYYNPETELNGCWGCNHPEQREVDEENGKEQGLCYCFCCPLGIESEAAEDYLLVIIGNSATMDEKQAMYNYELYMHRYDKKWLDAHGIVYALVE